MYCYVSSSWGESEGENFRIFFSQSFLLFLRQRWGEGWVPRNQKYFMFNKKTRQTCTFRKMYYPLPDWMSVYCLLSKKKQHSPLQTFQACFTHPAHTSHILYHSRRKNRYSSLCTALLTHTQGQTDFQPVLLLPISKVTKHLILTYIYRVKYIQYDSLLTW